MSFDPQPTLTGPTLLVRPITTSDWPEMFAAASDPQIWSLHPARDRYREPEFQEFFTEALASGAAFAVVDRSQNQIIGSSRYHGFDPDKREVEIGWTFLARSHWGGPANRELKTLMLDHAFNYVDTVIFWVAEANLRSRGAMEKIGGVLRPGIYDRTFNQTTYPHVIYEIRKP